MPFCYLESKTCSIWVPAILLFAIVPDERSGAAAFIQVY